MEPRIQYVKTSDGVNIAYAVFGEGTPLVYVTEVAGVHFYSEFSLARRATDQLTSSGFQVIRHDGRGTGSSDRAARDFSLEARLRDLEAVVNGLDLERFTLVGHLDGGLTAVAYATRHSERVSHLVLRDPYRSTTDFHEFFPGRRTLRVLRPVAKENWELVTLNQAHLRFGFTDSEVAKEYAAALQSAMSASVWVERWDASDHIDVTELLGAVLAPTLIILDTDLWGRRSAAGGDLRTAAMRVAAAIPGARLLATDDFAGAVAEFLREGKRVPEPPLPSGMTAILFTDIANSTALTERLGDAAFRAKARELGGLLRAVVRECAGAPVEGPTLGDGVLAVFTSAREAIEAARRCAAAGESAGLPLHLGVHAGDVTREKDPDGRDNVYGGAVNIASRIAGLSAAGEVLVSETVRSLARTSGGVSFEDRGRRRLKGVGDTVRVWAVRAGEA
jgi:class 3 adenylate cyclase